MTRPIAIVMNMFYTGLGIARSLGEQGIQVIGLTAHRRIYGNFTRYAKVRSCPDSREAPEALLAYLLDMGAKMGSSPVIFPTRDDDVLFLDRYREQLGRYFTLAITNSTVLAACMDKWETYKWAQKAGVASPRCRVVENERDLVNVAEEVGFPCVLKPISSHAWRLHGNWDLVGGRKAVAVHSQQQLSFEYAQISRADPRVLVQEMVPGGDDQLFVAACYLDKQSKPVASFTAQKLLQSPSTFGTGCIVQTVNRPELIEPAVRLLQEMGFTGIAEVEFKWDTNAGQFKLIEINARPWDQHPLGKACGVDLIQFAYCEEARLPMPPVKTQTFGHRWIAEDALLMAALRMLWKRDLNFRSLFRLARGRRIYAIWSARDPFPSIIYFISNFIPALIGNTLRAIWAVFKQGISERFNVPKERTAL